MMTLPVKVMMDDDADRGGDDNNADKGDDDDNYIDEDNSIVNDDGVDDY